MAALYVVMHHACLNLKRGQAGDRTTGILQFVFGWGHSAVDVFIVLSGFCLMLPVVNQAHFGNVRAFLLSRAVRLVLPYYAACVLSLILIALYVGDRTGTHWDASLPVTHAGLVTHALLIHQWWPDTRAQINHSLWSVGVEYQIYLLLPLIFWSFTKFGVWRTLAAIVPASFALWRTTSRLDFPDPSPWGTSVYYIALFAMGAAAAKARFGKDAVAPPSPGDSALLGGFSLVMLAVLAYEIWGSHEVSLQVVSFFVGAGTAAFIYLRSWHTSSCPDGLRHRCLQMLGARSFSLYLVHAPILQVAWLYVVLPMHLVHPGAQMLSMLGVGTALSLLCSDVFYRAVERPCHRLSRRLGRQQARAAS